MCNRCGNEVSVQAMLLENGSCYDCAVLLKEVVAPAAEIMWNCPTCDDPILMGQACQTCAGLWDELNDDNVGNIEDHDDMCEEEVTMAFCAGCGNTNDTCKCRRPPQEPHDPHECPLCHVDDRICGCLDDDSDDGMQARPSMASERMSVVVHRLQQRTKRPYAQVVQGYLASDRDEEAALLALGGPTDTELAAGEAAGRERVPSPERTHLRITPFFAHYMAQMEKTLRLGKPDVVDLPSKLDIWTLRSLVRRSVTTTTDGITSIPADMRELLKRAVGI
eukprot:gene3608-144_t